MWESVWRVASTGSLLGRDWGGLKRPGGDGGRGGVGVDREALELL